VTLLLKNPINPMRGGDLINGSSKKYLITINNPNEHGFDHETIKAILASLDLDYFIFGDEIGEKGTYHTHIFLFRHPLKKLILEKLL